MKRRWLLCVLSCLLSACPTPPAVLPGGAFSEVTVQDAQARDVIGQRVRWSGAAQRRRLRVRFGCGLGSGAPLPLAPTPAMAPTTSLAGCTRILSVGP